MKDMDKLVGFVTVLGALLLAVRGFRAKAVPFDRTVMIAVIWLGIIAAVAFILTFTVVSGERLSRY